MTRLETYRQKREVVLTQMETILDAAAVNEEADGRLTEEQQIQYDALEKKKADLDAAVDREAKIEAADRAAVAVRTVPANGEPAPARASVHLRADSDPQRGFANPREFMMACISDSGRLSRDMVRDERLRPLAQTTDADGETGRGELGFLMPRAYNPAFLQPFDPNYQAVVGSDEQGGYSDPHGGFLVQPTFLPQMLQLGFEGDPTTGRTQAVPMSSPAVRIPARTDKTHTTSVSGGFTVTRRPETVAATSSRMTMEMVTLQAASLFGLAFATEEILTDSPISFVAIIDAGFRDQFAHHMLNEKLRGLGGNEFIGAINGDATIAVTRDTATRILGTDVIAVRARCWNYSRAIWIANHDTQGELMRIGARLFDAEGATPLSGSATGYQLSLREDRPDTLLGRPIFYSEYASTLGVAGDLLCGVWSEYLEGVYQPVRSAESMHVRFVNHERAFKFWLRNAGAPWWRTALTPQQSSTTLSPFVTIAA